MRKVQGCQSIRPTYIIPTCGQTLVPTQHQSKNNMEQRQRSTGPVGGLLKGVGFVVGVATELHAHNKSRKASAQKHAQGQSESIRVDDLLEIGDEPPTYTETLTRDRSSNPKSYLSNEKAIETDSRIPSQRLPLPVILPQRRPNDKSRGFLRAYAPDLGEYKGIDEDTFLKFLKQFHQASQASGYFQVINIAALGASFAPSLIAMAVATSVQLASQAASEAQSRYRTNAYLDKANKELFHPKNLHCMIMAFKPEASESPLLNLGMDGSSSSGAIISGSRGDNDNGSGTGISMFGTRFRSFHGTTQGEFALPESASLVYSTNISRDTSPYPVEDSSTPREKESSWKSTAKFLSDYKDRRAQAKFAATYGDGSRLAVPGAADPGRFASTFSDPNANLLGFSPNNDRQTSTVDDVDGTRGRQNSQSSGLLGGMKKLMKQDLLYLLITEMPSDEEMRGFDVSSRV